MKTKEFRVSDTPKTHREPTGTKMSSEKKGSDTPKIKDSQGIPKDKVSKNPNLALPNNLDDLLPDRHPQADLFLCDVADAVLKDFMQEMEHPFYSLSKKPDTAVREYEHNGKKISITPSVKGLATIYDKDILIYAISQLIAALNRGEKVSQTIRINSRDFLVFANRGTGGKDYDSMVTAIERLRGTTIRTNIMTGGEIQEDVFGLIDRGTVRRKFGDDGRILWVELKISDWVFNAIREREVLTLSPDYFRLRKPLERRVYELARKHCGNQKQWKVSVDLLLKKSGSKSKKKQFKYMLGHIVRGDHLPDYHVELDDDDVYFYNRGTVPGTKGRGVVEAPALPSWAHEDAREAAPGWDPYYLEQEWKSWVSDQSINVNEPGKLFKKFCESWFEKNGRPK